MRKRKRVTSQPDADLPPVNVVREHDSLAEFTRWASRPWDRSKTLMSSRSSDAGSPWYGCTFDEAIELGLNGWAEGTKHLAEYQDSVQSTLHSAGLAPRDGGEASYDWGRTAEGGRGEIDVATYLTGDPECIVARVDASTASSIRIYVDCSASFMVDGAKMTERGAILAAMIDALHQRGVLVELWAGQRMTNGESVYASWVKLKANTEPLDIQQVVYALAHPSFLRRLGFSALEAEPFAFQLGCVTGGYGRSIVGHEDIRVMPTSFFEKTSAACVLLPAITTSWRPWQDVQFMREAGVFACLP